MTPDNERVKGRRAFGLLPNAILVISLLIYIVLVGKITDHYFTPPSNALGRGA